MPHAYFESDGFTGLKEVYDRALAVLATRQPIPVELRDAIAARIFSIASDGHPSDEVILKAALRGLVPEALLDTLPPRRALKALDTERSE
jgi:hypothetical protein